MGRGAVGQAAQQEAEALLRVLLGDAQQLEDLLLHAAVVDTHRPATELGAVERQVVGTGQRGTGVIGERVDRLGRGGGEGVVQRVPALGVLVPLEHRPVGDPDEAPLPLRHHAAVVGQGDTQRTHQLAGELGLAGPEEDGVALAGVARLEDPGDLALRHELRQRRAQRTVGLDDAPRQALGPTLLGEVDPAVELLAGQLAAAGQAHGDHGPAAVEDALEHTHAGVSEDGVEVDELHRVAQVGLVGAEAPHGLFIGHARERHGQLLPEHVVPQLDHQLLADAVDVLLVDEGRLDVELGELGLAVGAQVLVTEAPGDLVVPLEPRDHQQLLEQLRRLGQRVEGPRLQARGHEEVAGPLGRGAGQDRRLDVEEAVALHHPTHDRGDLGAGADAGGELVAAQVDVAMRQPHALVGLDAVLDGERRGVGGAQHLHGRGEDLDLTGGELLVGLPLGTGPDGAGHADDVLVADVVHGLQRLTGGGVGDDLAHPAAVTQVEERHAPVIAAAGNPPGQDHLLPVVAGADRAGAMGSHAAVGVHESRVSRNDGWMGR